MTRTKRKPTRHADPPPIHERVKARVDAAGLTNADIAKETGWHYLRVMRLMNGDTELSAADMETLARILKCEAGDLYGSEHPS